MIDVKSTTRLRMSMAVALATALPAIHVRAQSSDTSAAPPPATSTPTAKSIQLPPVKVSSRRFDFTPDQRLQKEGTAADGYRVSTVSSVGNLGSMKIQDAPYSFFVLPQELIQNVQATSPQSVFDIAPTLNVNLPEASGITERIESRGFKIDSAEDGMRFLTFNFGPVAIEDKERIEVLNGLGGFLYGSTDPGGMLNYVLKRPTAAPLATITTGYYGGSGYVHGDFGGPIGDGRFGYRLNVVDQSGGQPVQDQSIQRSLISGAFDWHVTDKLLLQFDAAHQNYRIDSPTAIWNLTGLDISAPNASRDWTEPFAYTAYNTTSAGTRLKWDISDALSFRAGYKYRYSDTQDVGVQNLAINPNGTYNQFVNKLVNQIAADEAAYGLFDLNVNTGPVKHQITAGVFGNIDHGSVPLDNNPRLSVPGFDFFNPGLDGAAQQAAALGAAGLLTGLKPNADFIRDYNYNAVLGDVVQFNPSLSAIVGANYVTIRTYNYSNGIPSTSYSQSKVTPSASLIYKPVPAVSTYVTYIEGLEAGGVAGLTSNGLPVTNPGEAAPTTDRQYEVGVKANIGSALLTVALFDINKASEVYAPNADDTAVTFSNNGREEHKGGEITLTGKVTRDLTLFGGVTAFDAKITQQPAMPQYIGKRPIGVSEFMAKLYAEYQIRPIPGLSINGGFQWYGNAPLNSQNTASTPGYVVANVGARYETRLFRTPTVFRLNVLNVSNNNYWIPGGVQGGGTAVEGVPRTVLATVEFSL